MQRVLVFLFGILSVTIGLSQQNVYELKKNNEIAYLGLGMGSIATSWYLERQVAPLSKVEIGDLNANSVNSFDRWATGQYSKGAKLLSEGLIYGVSAIPLGVGLLANSKKGKWTIGVMFIETMSITYGLTHVVKGVLPRTRPFMYNSSVDLEVKLTKKARNSFFSGHTSYAAAASFFTANVIGSITENETIKTIIWAGALTVPAVAGYLRMKAGKHFLTDVATGYLFGATVGYLIPQLHKVSNKSDVSIVPYFGAETSGVYVSIPLSISRKFQDY